MFTPILKDQPIDFAFKNKDYFRNVARENRWGTPVYFFPSTNIYDETGCGGYYYTYGYNYNAKKGMKGNCTYWCGCRYHMLSNIVLKEVIGRAIDTYGKYKGNKDGGNLNGQYIGATIQNGDMLIFADNKNLSGDGHIVFVEQVEGETLHISESAYSSKSIYEGKACITYTLKKSDMITGKYITLRPSMPYSEYLYGVIHTGDIFQDEKDYKKLYEKERTKNEKVKEYVKEIEKCLNTQ